MIHDLKPYPAMKDSGVPWLRQVPEHWEVRRLKYLLRERDQRSSNGQEQLLRVSQYTGVTERKRADGGNEPDTRAASLVGYKRVAPNELVINIMLAWNGSMGVSHYAGIASPAYCVYGFNQTANPWYFHHLLRSPSYKARIKAVSTGVVESRLRLYTDDLFRLEAILPPPNEQAAIVRYLDYADRRIRKAIAAKQRLIKLLQEQKQVIIHQAVTRGLDPNVKLKPSGVEWLGDVPVGWEVLPLNKTLSEKQVKNIGLRVSIVLSLSYGKIVVKAEEKLRGLVPESFETYQIIEPDIIIIRPTDLQNDQKSLRVGIAKQQGIITSAYMALKTKTASPDYIFWLLASYDYVKTFYNLGAGTRQSLKFSDIKRLPILIPASEEQQAIVQYIEAETAKLDQAITRANSEISLLREYRTRLIADVVTGKLDVREAAARLPEPKQDTLPDELNVGEDEELEGDDEGAEDVEE